MARALNSEAGIRVVGAVSAVGQLAARLGQGVDVVLMDYLLPDGTGADATRIVKAMSPMTKVVMLTAVDSDRSLLESATAGADAYLTKDRPIEDVVGAVRAVCEGSAHLDEAVRKEVRRRERQRRGEERLLTEPLTRRELEILDALAVGIDSPGVCSLLGISKNTLRTHVQHIVEKLNAHSRLEAVSIGLAVGLVQVGPASRPQRRARGRPLGIQSSRAAGTGPVASPRSRSQSPAARISASVDHP